MSPVAWLVLGVSVLATTAILLVGHERNRQAADVTKHVAAHTSRAGIELQSVVSVTETRAFFDVVADVSIANNSDTPLNYVGTPCYTPADVRFVTTLTAPAGPPYSAAATSLRSHVMDYRRSLNEGLSFTLVKGGTIAGAQCDESTAPVLPPHVRMKYRMTSPLGPASQPFIDATTTEVLTTLLLGYVPASMPGQLPPPMRVVDTIEVRTPVSALTDIKTASAADYAVASRHFDLLMKDPRVATWVNAQDPSLWRAARLMDPYPKAGQWRVEAFNHAWALPLVAAGTDSAVTQVTIPDERWKAAVSTDAVLPGGAASADKLDLPYHDLYVGDLVLPSGKVMVGDIVSGDGMLTFDYGLPPGGRYPIHLVITRPRYVAEDYETVAWEELLLSSSPVVRWEPAIPVGHTAAELKPGELFIWGTDGGQAGFASPEAMKFMDATLLDPEFGLYGSIGEREEANDWLWGMITVDKTNGANVFATTTGGDGGFPVLLGVDAQGSPSVLLSDFGNLRMKFSGIN